jgi:hypothetical protein
MDEDVLDYLGSDHLAGTAPGGEAVEDEETLFGEDALPFSLPVQIVIICLRIREALPERTWRDCGRRHP